MDDEAAGKALCCFISLGAILIIVLHFLRPEGTFLILALSPFSILSILGVSLYLVSAGIDERGQKIAKYGFIILCIIVVAFISFPFILSKTWTNMNHEDIAVIAISEDGSKVSVGEPGGQYAGSGVYLYDGYTGVLLWQKSNIAASYMKISSDGNYMIVGTDRIYLIDTSDGTVVSTYDFNKGVSSALISSDGNYYTALCNNGTIFLFKKGISNPVWIYSSSIIITIDITSDGSFVVAGSQNNNVYLFNNTSSTPTWSYATGADVNSVSISSNGAYFLVGCENNNTHFFKKDQGTPEWTYALEHSVTYVQLSNDAQKAIAVTEHTISSYTYPYLYSINPLLSNSYTKLSIPSDLDLGMYSLSDDTSYLIDCRMTSHTGSRSVAGGRELYGYNAGEIELYKISGGEIASISVINRPHVPLNAVISGDGNYIAYCGDTNKAYENHGMHLIDLAYPTYHNIALMGIYLSLGIIPTVMVIAGKKGTSYKRSKSKKKKGASKMSFPTQKFEVSTLGGQNICPNCGNPVSPGNRVCWKCFTEF
jgi:hypothetical protein